MMTADEFRQLVEQARSDHPQWFELPSDSPPDDQRVADTQSALGVELPEQYVEFIREFGGGDFVFLVVYSMDPGSEVEIVSKNSVSWLSRADFVAVSDNGAGDYYGFAVSNDRCEAPVLFLDHESGDLRPTGFEDWYAFAAEHGLNP